MNTTPQHPIITALNSVTELFTRMDVPYMVFGGIANSIYGNPRQTFDIDIKFILETDIEQFLEGLNRIGRVLPEYPIKFISETNVIPIDVHGIKVDLVRAELPFEKEAIRRSRPVNFLGIGIKVCTPEDLIIHKAVSVREKDWADIQFIIENMKNDMDWDYLLGHCQDLSVFLNDPDILNRVKRYRNASATSDAS
jgi:hypothetical protein